MNKDKKIIMEYKQDLEMMRWIFIILIIYAICITITILVYHPITITYDIGDNALEGIKNLNWSAIPK